MHIDPPSDDALAALLADNQHRYPEKFTVTVIGDHGEKVSIPFLVGTPKGSGDPKTGDKPSMGWATFIAVALQVEKSPADLDLQLSSESVIFPAKDQWSKLTQRWPSLPASIGGIVATKIGAVSDAVIEPTGDPPKEIAAAMAAHPRAAWRRFATSGGSFDVAIDPPEGPAWRIFKNNLKQAGAPIWKVARERSCASIVACINETGTDIPVSDVYLKAPGLVAHTTAILSELTGAAAEVSAGGW